MIADIERVVWHRRQKRKDGRAGDGCGRRQARAVQHIAIVEEPDIAPLRCGGQPDMLQKRYDVAEGRIRACWLAVRAIEVHVAVEPRVNVGRHQDVDVAQECGEAHLRSLRRRCRRPQNNHFVTFTLTAHRVTVRFGANHHSSSESVLSVTSKKKFVVPYKAPATLVQRATAWLEERGGCARADLRTPTL
eukprot:scaffold9532_cov143-Isochrysis_galbana.AAC.4